MHRALLGFAALSAIALVSPAQGQSFTEGGFSASSGLRNIRFGTPPPEIGPGRYLPVIGGCRGEHCRHVHVGEGAEPGDVLEVEILDVRLRQDWGYNFIRPLAGTLPEDFHETRTSTVRPDHR